MPLYMDLHRNLKVSPEALAEAHYRDVEVQEKYGVVYHKYWFNRETGTCFCLVEGPDRETCDRVHAESHGLVAEEIIEVESKEVASFLGPGPTNPGGAVVAPGAGSLDRGLRTLLLTEVENLPHVASRLGDAAAVRLLQRHDALLRTLLARCDGTEVNHTGEGILASFPSASGAVRCAVELQRATREGVADPLQPLVRVGIAAGEPVTHDAGLFGATVQLARRLCEAAEPGQILASAGVRELCLGSGAEFEDLGRASLRGVAMSVGVVEVRWAAEPAVERTPQQAIAPVSLRRRLANAAAELRRRKVIRAAVVYAAVSFVVLQVADLTLQPLGLPAWSYTLVVVLAIIGFPLALSLAWALEVGPEGEIRRTAERAPRQF